MCDVCVRTLVSAHTHACVQTHAQHTQQGEYGQRMHDEECADTVRAFLRHPLLDFPATPLHTLSSLASYRRLGFYDDSHASIQLRLDMLPSRQPASPPAPGCLPVCLPPLSLSRFVGVHLGKLKGD